MRPRQTKVHYLDTPNPALAPVAGVQNGEHGQTAFLLERMNRSWFNQWWQRYIWASVLGCFWGWQWVVLRTFFSD